LLKNLQQSIILAHKQANTSIIVLDEYFIFKVLSGRILQKGNGIPMVILVFTVVSVIFYKTA